MLKVKVIWCLHRDFRICGMLWCLFTYYYSVFLYIYIGLYMCIVKWTYIHIHICANESNNQLSHCALRSRPCHILKLWWHILVMFFAEEIIYCCQNELQAPLLSRNEYFTGMSTTAQSRRSRLMHLKKILHNGTLTIPYINIIFSLEKVVIFYMTSKYNL